MGTDPTWFNYSGDARGHQGLFRSADLNAAGWLAVLVPGAVVALGGVVLFGWPLPSVLVGAGCSWLVALAVDTVEWRRIPTGLSVSDLTHAQAEQIVKRIGFASVELRLSEANKTDLDNDWGSFQTTNRYLKDLHQAIDAERQGEGT